MHCTLPVAATHTAPLAPLPAYAQSHPGPPRSCATGAQRAGKKHAPDAMAARDAALPADYRVQRHFDPTRHFLLKCNDASCLRADLVESNGFPLGVFIANKVKDADGNYGMPAKRKLQCHKHTTVNGKRTCKQASIWQPPPAALSGDAPTAW